MIRAKPTQHVCVTCVSYIEVSLVLSRWNECLSTHCSKNASGLNAQRMP